jgi:hypothetical protein
MLQHGRDLINKGAGAGLDSVFYLPSTGEDHPDEWPMDRGSFVRQLTGGRKMLVAFALVLAAAGGTVLLTSAWLPTSGPKALVVQGHVGEPTNTGSLGSARRTFDPERR